MNTADRATTPRAASAAACSFRLSAAAAEPGAIGEQPGEDHLARLLPGERLRDREQRLRRPVAQPRDEDRALRSRRLRELERRILAQDRALELLQRRARLDPELVDEHASRGLVGGQRLGLAARPVEREHQLAAQALAQGMLGRERLELRDQRGVPAEGEVGVDPPLDREQVHLLEAPDRRLRERLVGEVGERRPAPERERLAQPLGGLLRLGAAGLLDETLEPVEIELLRREPDHVAGRERDEQLGAGAERLAQPRDARLERAGVRLRGLVRPQLLDQPARRDDLVRVEEEQREQAALPLPAQIQQRDHPSSTSSGPRIRNSICPPSRVCRLSVACKRPIAFSLPDRPHRAVAEGKERQMIRKSHLHGDEAEFPRRARPARRHLRQPTRSPTIERKQMSVPTRLLVASVSIISFAALALVPAGSASSPRSGILHLTKECSQYTGEAGSFCTITSSNLNAIPVGTKDVAVDAAGADGSLDTDLVFYTRGANAAFGHLVICGPCEVGTVTFDGGTGQFKKFHANLLLYCPIGGIAHDGRVDACRLDGPYSFDN